MSQILTNLYVQVEHLTVDTLNSSTEGYVLDLGLQAVPVNIQPSSPEVMALTGGIYGKAFTLFTTYSGIITTDRLTVVSGTNSSQYLVRGRQNYNYGYGKHLEVYVEEILA